MTATSSTVAKAFQILALFRDHPVVSSSRCEQELDIPRSTAHRLLASLEDVGAIELSGQGQYRLSLSLFELGVLAPARRDLEDRAGSQLEVLADRTGARIHLGVRKDHRVLYLETAHGRRAQAQNMRTPAGFRGPLHATALGKIVLAYSPPEVIDEVLRRGLKRYTRHTRCEPADLRDHLEVIRDRGYECSEEEYVLGSSSVAVPIREPGGRVTAALAIAMDTSQMNNGWRSLLEEARRGAVGIERGIGLPSSRGPLGRPRTLPASVSSLDRVGR